MSLTLLLLGYKRLSPWKRSVIFGVFFVLPVLVSAFISYYLKLSLERALHERSLS